MKFTIRDLLWLVVVAALCAGWYLQQRRLSDQIAQLQSKVRANELITQQLDRLIADPQLLHLPGPTIVPGRPAPAVVPPDNNLADTPIDNMPIFKPQKRGSVALVPPAIQGPQPQVILPKLER
jgi:hypothetical protein